MIYVKEFQISTDIGKKEYQDLLNNENYVIIRDHVRTDKYNNLYITVWYKDYEY